ncbi:MAG: hydrogenase nickel incorporation protein HypB [Alphaproteobacteria bacterium]|nr:hydrogenase nickel incorporation protein HypB [Alphaproteobacteria bacterium]
MCTVCGCGKDAKKQDGHTHDHDHDHHHDHGHHHHHDHVHSHGEHGDLHFGMGESETHIAGISQSRIVQIAENILAKNDHLAAHNRAHFRDLGVLTLNLMSSPGSGKTTLLARTCRELSGHGPLAVIEGDQQTANDAERIRATGVPAIQINTGKGCHLDADMVGRAVHDLDLGRGALLFIENVGNLVCPAGFDLGEAAKVVILSVTEGEDKPLKYPEMFRAARLMVLNKSDLLPYVPFDVDVCVDYARRVNPDIEVLTLSAHTGDGMEGWLDWIRARQVEAGA